VNDAEGEVHVSGYAAFEAGGRALQLLAGLIRAVPRRGTDLWGRTGYSCVPPGGRGLRAVLAQPVAGVLLFAGEATHVTRPCTVHGAFESGERAATEVSQPA
jgi:Flavin containing amine oxidoreductase